MADYYDVTEEEETGPMDCYDVMAWAADVAQGREEADVDDAPREEILATWRAALRALWKKLN